MEVCLCEGARPDYSVELLAFLLARSLSLYTLFFLYRVLITSRLCHRMSRDQKPYPGPSGICDLRYTPKELPSASKMAMELK